MFVYFHLHVYIYIYIFGITFGDVIKPLHILLLIIVSDLLVYNVLY